VTRSHKREHVGRQQPRVLHRPEFDSEDAAEEAISLIEACGQILDIWQQIAVRMVLATKAGRWAATVVGFLVARQNGKGGILEAVALWCLFIGGGTTMWTAHELKTSDEAYARVVHLIRANAELASMVAVWNGGLTGMHIIELKPEFGGARLVFLARSKSSGRGFSPRRIILDEAQELSLLAVRALRYATAAQGAERLLIYCGTVPGPENNAEAWTGIRDRGRAGKGGVAWAEWTPEGSDDPDAKIDPKDWTVREWSNPALGTRIDVETIEDEYAAAEAEGDIEGFLRERLSVWPNQRDEKSRVIDVGDWKACPPLEPMQAPVTLALEVSLDRKRAWLVAVGSNSEGNPQVEMVPTVQGGDVFEFDGVAGIPSRVAEVVMANPDIAAFAVDKFGEAASLIGPIERAIEALEGGKQRLRKLTVDQLGGPQWVEAGGRVQDAIRHHELGHGDSRILFAAVRGADVTKRDGVRVFKREISGPAAGPFFALLCGWWGWQRAGKPRIRPEIF